MMSHKGHCSVALLLMAVLLLAGCSAAPVAPLTPKQDTASSQQLARQLVRDGRLAFEEGRNHSAMESWQAAVNLNPKDATTVNNLALLYSEEKRFRDAVRLLENGLMYSPDTAELHLNLAVISELYLLDLETALRHYRRYRELSREDDARVAGWIADLERRVD